MTINITEYTYAKLMELALSFVEDYEEENNITVDKRQGSIIYDALAPFCQVLANVFLDLYNFNSQLYVTTATGENLDLRVSDIGMKRNAATNAIAVAEFKDANNNRIAVDIGKRFSTISDTNPIIYRVTEKWSTIPGYYKVVCETAGTVGNNYIGPITPLEDITGLASANIISYLKYGVDEETDEQLRSRYLELVRTKPFGGNIADYKNKLVNEVGLGAAQVYPVFNGGGTVKVSVIKPDFSPCNSSEIANIQNILDPETSVVDVSNIASWESGSLRYANGNTISSDVRIRTSDYLLRSNITSINCQSGYKFAIYVYSGPNTGSYQGILQTDNTYSKSSTICYFTSNKNIESIPDNYYLKIILSTTDDSSSIDASTDYVNITLTKTYYTQGTGLGLAPIGHTVTVVTPNEVSINISATLVLETGKVIGDVEEPITENITNYIQSVKENWGNSDELNNYKCTIYLSQIIYKIMDVEGVVSVSSVTINGNASNLILTESASTQQLPKMGSVTLNV